MASATVTNADAKNPAPAPARIAQRTGVRATLGRGMRRPTIRTSPNSSWSSEPSELRSLTLRRARGHLAGLRHIEDQRGCADREEREHEGHQTDRRDRELPADADLLDVRGKRHQ